MPVNPMLIALLMMFTLSTAGWAHGPSDHAGRAKRPISTEEKSFGREGHP